MCSTAAGLLLACGWWVGAKWGRMGFSERKTRSGQDVGSKGPLASLWALQGRTLGSGLWADVKGKQLAFTVLGRYSTKLTACAHTTRGRPLHFPPFTSEDNTAGTDGMPTGKDSHHPKKKEGPGWPPMAGRWSDPGRLVTQLIGLHITLSKCPAGPPEATDVAQICQGNSGTVLHDWEGPQGADLEGPVGLPLSFPHGSGPPHTNPDCPESRSLSDKVVLVLQISGVEKRTGGR